MLFHFVVLKKGCPLNSQNVQQGLTDVNPCLKIADQSYLPAPVWQSIKTFCSDTGNSGSTCALIASCTQEKAKVHPRQQDGPPFQSADLGIYAILLYVK
jgi:hypothetical protein